MHKFSEKILTGDASKFLESIFVWVVFGDVHKVEWRPKGSKGLTVFQFPQFCLNWPDGKSNILFAIITSRHYSRMTRLFLVHLTKLSYAFQKMYTKKSPAWSDYLCGGGGRGWLRLSVAVQMSKFWTFKTILRNTDLS